MAFWHRFRNSNLKTLSIQFQRCYIHLPHASAPKPSPMEIPLPYPVFHGRPTSVFNTVRFFAAPIQVNFQTLLVGTIKAVAFALYFEFGCSVMSYFSFRSGYGVVGLSLVLNLTILCGIFQFQVKPKNEEEDSDGYRLNEKIKAPYVRLVVDEGKYITYLNFYS